MSLPSLKFRPDHCVVSLISTFQVAKLRTLVAPAQVIVRAAPLPAVARRMGGALVIYPPVPQVGALLEGLGQLVQLESELSSKPFWVDYRVDEQLFRVTR